MSFQSVPYSYDQCDSYFVEAPVEERPSMSQRLLLAREKKALARERQYELADELSRLTALEYQDDILEYLQQVESETLPQVASIDQQTEIQWYMRPYLLDFMLEMHATFALLPETLHLAVNILDRYCSKRIVYKRHYQLVGCASILIAAKYNDKKEHVPTIRDLRNTCGGLFDDVMFIQMEWHILQTLGWSIGHPTIDSFLQLALVDEQYDPELEHMAWYITEISMYHRDFVSTRPSILSRAALALARCVLGREQQPTTWGTTYDSMTTINLSQFLGHPSLSLARKYSSQHYSSVACTLEEFLMRQAATQALLAAPPTPPMEPDCVNYDSRDVYMQKPHEPTTPHHSQYAAVHHGYLTPPITPDAEHPHVVMPPKAVPVRCPLTPTPSGPMDQTVDNMYHYQTACHVQQY